MKFEFIGIYDKNNLKSERIHIRATSNLDIRFCVLIDTFYRDESNIQAGQRPCYWFPSKGIKTGENIVLYTRDGVASSESRTDGTIFHFFFRGLTLPIYTEDKLTISILEISDWITPPHSIPAVPATPPSDILAMLGNYGKT